VSDFDRFQSFMVSNARKRLISAAGCSEHRSHRGVGDDDTPGSHLNSRTLAASDVIREA
jgi:hypothetical protein